MTNQAHNEPAQGILSTLSEWQYLRPHRPLADVIADAVARLGVCPDAAQRAIDWLELDASRSVGRLRATELTQLSRCMARFWEEAANPAVPTERRKSSDPPSRTTTATFP